MKRLFPLAFLAGMILSVLAPVAAGPVGAAEVFSVSTTVTSSFPSALTFGIRAQSDAAITRITLRYKVEKISIASVVSDVQPPFASAPLVETSWTWDMRRSSLPPGAVISYRWIVRDAAGNLLDTDWKSFTFEDDRYTWNVVTSGKVSLLWYQGDNIFARELLDSSIAALEKIAEDTGVQLERPVKLYIYADTNDLRGALIFPQEWTGGVAFTEYGIVSIGVAPDNLIWGKGTVAHELTHLALYQMTYNPYGDIPTWLNEGLATYAQGTLDYGFQALLDQAVSQDRLFSVPSLSGSFPTDPTEAQLSYAESYSLVDYLIRTHGRDKMLLLLNTFKQGSTQDNALRAAYGFDADELEITWRSSLGLGPRQAPSPSPVPAPGITPGPSVTPAPKGGFGCSAAGEGSSVLAAAGSLGILLLLPVSRQLLRSRKEHRQSAEPTSPRRKS